MTEDNEVLIGGETVADLVGALRGIAFGPVERGMVHVDGVIGPPATRAIMRLEAELLLMDADRLGASAPGGRTAEQRRADAFVRLVEQLEEVARPNG